MEVSAVLFTTNDEKDVSHRLTQAAPLRDNSTISFGEPSFF